MLLEARCPGLARQIEEFGGGVPREVGERCVCGAGHRQQAEKEQVPCDSIGLAIRHSHSPLAEIEARRPV